MIGFGEVMVKGFFSILERGERWSVARLTSSLFGRERIDHPVFFYFFLSFLVFFRYSLIVSSDCWGSRVVLS